MPLSETGSNTEAKSPYPYVGLTRRDCEPSTTNIPAIKPSSQGSHCFVSCRYGSEPNGWLRSSRTGATGSNLLPKSASIKPLTVLAVFSFACLTE